MCASLQTLSTVVSFIAIALSASGLFADPVPAGAIVDVQADAVQPKGAPVLLSLTFTNTGTESASYWSGGPGKYPNGSMFTARVTDANGKTRELTLANWQYESGSGGHFQVQPGQSVTLPAAIEPLPADSYTIEVRGGRGMRARAGKAAKVVVKDDPQVARAREQDLLDRIRQGEPFAQRLVSAYPAEAVTRALLQDLLSKDGQLALRAAHTLERVHKLPADAGKIVNEAMRMHLDAEEKKSNRTTALVDSLAAVAANVGSDDALPAVLVLIESDLGGQRAVSQLGRFKQEKATKALRELLKANRLENRFEAARMLAERKDAAGIDVLLAFAANGQTEYQRGYAFLALANFPADPRVEPAIKKGLDDSGEFARVSAKQALKELGGRQNR
jgi:hypothetical protein